MLALQKMGALERQLQLAAEEIKRLVSQLGEVGERAARNAAALADLRESSFPRGEVESMIFQLKQKIEEKRRGAEEAYRQKAEAYAALSDSHSRAREEMERQHSEGVVEGKAEGPLVALVSREAELKDARRRLAAKDEPTLQRLLSSNNPFERFRAWLELKEVEAIKGVIQSLEVSSRANGCTIKESPRTLE